MKKLKKTMNTTYCKSREYSYGFSKLFIFIFIIFTLLSVLPILHFYPGVCSLARSRVAVEICALLCSPFVRCICVFGWGCVLLRVDYHSTFTPNRTR